MPPYTRRAIAAFHPSPPGSIVREMEPPGVAPEFPPCHSGVLLLYDDPASGSDLIDSGPADRRLAALEFEWSHRELHPDFRLAKAAYSCCTMTPDCEYGPENAGPRTRTGPGCSSGSSATDTPDLRVPENDAPRIVRMRGRLRGRRRASRIRPASPTRKRVKGARHGVECLRFRMACMTIGGPARVHGRILTSGRFSGVVPLAPCGSSSGKRKWRRSFPNPLRIAPSRP